MGTLQRQPSASSGEPADRAVDDPAVFVQLYRRHYDGVFRYCVHRLFERHTAEDVTSEVFLKAAKQIHRFRGREERQFRSWLFRVATNEINSHVRKTARRQKLLRRFHQGPEQIVTVCEDSNAEHLARLKEAVFRLKPRYQTIITLRFFENLRLTEIAEVLGCSPGTARSQLARAIAQLRKRLKAASVRRAAGGEHDE
jgi:RNA polymerase sigma-70 factor (ECF subfamily)